LMEGPLPLQVPAAFSGNSECWALAPASIFRLITHYFRHSKLN
jgi:hypothetical protein